MMIQNNIGWVLDGRGQGNRTRDVWNNSIFKASTDQTYRFVNISYSSEPVWMDANWWNDSDQRSECNLNFSIPIPVKDNFLLSWALLVSVSFVIPTSMVVSVLYIVVADLIAVITLCSPSTSYRSIHRITTITGVTEPTDCIYAATTSRGGWCTCTPQRASPHRLVTWDDPNVNSTCWST